MTVVDVDDGTLVVPIKFDGIEEFGEMIVCGCRTVAVAVIPEEEATCGRDCEMICDAEETLVDEACATVTMK